MRGFLWRWRKWSAEASISLFFSAQENFLPLNQECRFCIPQHRQRGRICRFLFEKEWCGAALRHRPCQRTDPNARTEVVDRGCHAALRVAVALHSATRSYWIAAAESPASVATWSCSIASETRKRPGGLRAATGMPVILPRSLLARVAAELAAG